ncbi:MAG: YbjN domain-containing protein [Cytophagales bacterium]|nr:YbjN domain-containing protein [Bernardetiaceae bacterium]MDW8204413.1 YbjN domain-containing protein [Cytophagales bacterium]
MNLIAKLCMDYLREEGYVPKLDSDGDVVFKYEGKFFIVTTDEKDEQFLRVVMPNFWQIESERERLLALQVANQVNERIKVTKVVVKANNHVWAMAEQFIDSTPDLEDFFKRTLRVLTAAADEFAQRMLQVQRLN